MRFSRRRDPGLDTLEILETVTELQGWAAEVGVGLLSFPIDVVAQQEWIALAGWVTMAPAVVMPVYACVRGRKRPPRTAG